MSDNLVLELLRAIRGDIGRMARTLEEHGHRLTRMEIAMAGLRRDHASDAEARAYHEVTHDRLRERVERIERRLELTDAT